MYTQLWTFKAQEKTNVEIYWLQITQIHNHKKIVNRKNNEDKNSDYNHFGWDSQPKQNILKTSFYVSYFYRFAILALHKQEKGIGTLKNN